MSISAKEHYVTLSFDYCPNPLRSAHLHPILKIHHNSCYRAFSRTRSNTLHRSYRNGHAHRLLDVLAITTTCSGFGVSDCLRPPLLSDFKVKQTSSYLFSLVLRSAYTNPSTHEIACRSIKGLGCATGITTLDIRFTCDQRTSPGFDLPKRRPLHPQQPVFNVFHRGGLQFGHQPYVSRGLCTVTWGNCAIQGSDTPAKRLQRASHGAKPPRPSALRAREDQTRTYTDRLS